MALILKGQKAAEVKIQVVVALPDTTDTFTAVFKRGNKAAFDAFNLELSAMESDEKNKKILTDWLIRLEDLEDAETGKKITVEAETILPVILNEIAYTSAIATVAIKAISNSDFEKQRLGNWQK